MSVEELIAELQKIQAETGDVQVYVRVGRFVHDLDKASFDMGEVFRGLRFRTAKVFLDVKESY